MLTPSDINAIFDIYEKVEEIDMDEAIEDNNIVLEETLESKRVKTYLLPLDA
ncbi:5786_t:CDS:2 [Cetraspora pellucida]|uniref:5786_t:CDS:1 n=1 Tax=Cetraspora pellucida TaxID=1433469 RepID=A0A9N9C5U8_9GLOM|nr:5786_t:CDS:2 [Cetraspora pellucida]